MAYCAWSEKRMAREDALSTSRPSSKRTKFALPPPPTVRAVLPARNVARGDRASTAELRSRPVRRLAGEECPPVVRRTTPARVAGRRRPARGVSPSRGVGCARAGIRAAARRLRVARAGARRTRHRAALQPPGARARGTRERRRRRARDAHRQRQDARLQPARAARARRGRGRSRALRVPAEGARARPARAPAGRRRSRSACPPRASSRSTTATRRPRGARRSASTRRAC